MTDPGCVFLVLAEVSSRGLHERLCLGNLVEHNPMNELGSGSRMAGSGRTVKFRGLGSILPVLAVVLTMFVLIPEFPPLGVPNEWVWLRQPLPEDLTSFLDRALPAVLSAAILIYSAMVIDRRIAGFGKCGVSCVLLFLTILTVFWQYSVLQTASSPHRELRPLWVLYDKYATGYYLHALTEPRETWLVLQEYEREMSEGDVLHRGTHPPGLFLFNRAALWLTSNYPGPSSLLLNFVSVETVTTFRRLEAEAALAAPLKPDQFTALILTSLVSVVFCSTLPAAVYGLISHFTSRQDAWRACVLAAAIPAISVFQPRSDVLYAPSATVLLLLLSMSLRGRSMFWRLLLSTLAGGWLFACLLISLAHLPVLMAGALFVLLLMFAAWQRGRSATAKGMNSASADLVAKIPVNHMLPCTMIILAFLVSLYLFKRWTGCSMFSVWRWNLANHAAFYGQFPRTWWKWLPVNVMEMLFSAGLPVCLAVMRGGIQGYFRKSDEALFESKAGMPTDSSGRDSFETAESGRLSLRLLSIALAVTWVLLLFSGKNMGEAARLWCFVTPWWLILLSGTGNLSVKSGRSRVGWGVLLVCQMLVCAITTGRVSGYLQM